LEKLAIGKIIKAFGVKGYAKVLSFSGEWEHWKGLQKMEVRSQKGQSKTLTLEHLQFRGQDTLIKFDEIGSPEAMKPYHGWEIVVPKEQAAPLGEGEVYLTDLIGLSLMFEKEKVGEVTGVMDGPQADLLEVKKIDRTTVYIPYMEQYLGEIDFTTKAIELKVDWILE
jgi:16S rRNA processing protein RimM